AISLSLSEYWVQGSPLPREVRNPGGFRIESSGRLTRVPGWIERYNRLHLRLHIRRREQRAILLDLADRPLAPLDVFFHPVDSAPEREHREQLIHVAVALPIAEVGLLDPAVSPQMNHPRASLFLEHSDRA